jgi:hypothetical protein
MLSQYRVCETVPVSSRFPQHARVGIYPIVLQAGGRGLAIPGVILCDARLLGEHDEAKNKQRHASVEDDHSAPPLGAREAIFSRPVVTERSSIHVISVMLSGFVLVFQPFLL